MLDDIARRFEAIAPAADFWSIRLIDGLRQCVSVRQGVVQPVENRRSRGALISVVDGGRGLWRDL